MRFLKLALCSALFSTFLFGQAGTGTISGTITDPSKAPIPNASVSITNADTSVTVWTGATNDSGVYRAPNLPAGRYNVAVTAGGFKRQQVSDVNLAVDQRADIPLTLQVAADEVIE